MTCFHSLLLLAFIYTYSHISGSSLCPLCTLLILLSKHIPQQPPVTVPIRITTETSPNPAIIPTKEWIGAAITWLGVGVAEETLRGISPVSPNSSSTCKQSILAQVRCIE